LWVLGFFLIEMKHLHWQSQHKRVSLGIGFSARQRFAGLLHKRDVFFLQKGWLCLSVLTAAMDVSGLFSFNIYIDL